MNSIDWKVWLPRAAAFVALMAFYAFGVWAGWFPLNPFDPLLELGERVRAVLPKYGPWAPVVYVLFYALQIVAAPVPGAALAYTAGYLFGPVMAPIYSMTGILLGSAIGFAGARKLGWPLIEKMAPASWIERWRGLAAVNSSFTWFLVMLAPTADVFYFIAGMTTLSFRRFMLIVILGRTPGILLSSILGANIETFGGQWIFVLIACMLIIALAGHWVRVRVQKRVPVAAVAARPTTEDG